MISKTLFGKTKEGKEVYEYTLTAGAYTVKVLEYGCRFRQILVPDKHGDLVDVVIGFDTLAEYEADTSSQGAFVGRVANRIENATFAIDGKTYHLEANNGPNHNHGVWNKRVFESKVEGDTLCLTYHSPEGEDGYPGNVDVAVRLTLDAGGNLTQDYMATTDKATPINLTNHSYFNLAGSGSVLDTIVQIYAQKFTRSNEKSCPFGTIDPVAGTPMDFTVPKTLGQDIDADYDQLKWAHGYDHNWCVDGTIGELRPAAWALNKLTGIRLDCLTTQAGVQLYTANWLTPEKCGVEYGKGVELKPQHAFCFEVQNYPCAINRPNFPNAVLRPGEVKHEVCVYRFSVQS